LNRCGDVKNLFSFKNEKIICHDLRYRLPFKDKAFSGVYLEHTLEHLYPFEAITLLSEIYRILKPNGVITAQVGSQDKKPEQVEKWLDVFNKNFGNTTLDRVYIPSFDCSWNFSSSINH